MAIEKMLDAAADWWFAQFQNPTKDNGASDFANLMAQGMALELANSTPCPTDPRPFGDALKKAYADRPFNTLSADYAPGGPLADAMDTAGISRERAPWKTVMWLELGRVVVRAGYGAPEVVIFRS
jgi:hypothetical protein